MRTRLQPEMPAVSDDEVRSLLERYAFPVPFHAVRTRFLGSITAPGFAAASPDTVKALSRDYSEWRTGGILPKCHWLPFRVWCISGSRAF